MLMISKFHILIPSQIFVEMRIVKVIKYSGKFFEDCRVLLYEKLGNLCRRRAYGGIA